MFFINKKEKKKVITKVITKWLYKYHFSYKKWISIEYLVLLPTRVKFTKINYSLPQQEKEEMPNRLSNRIISHGENLQINQ